MVNKVNSLKKKIDFSYREAVRFMQIATKFGNVPTLAHLTTSKV